MKKKFQLLGRVGLVLQINNYANNTGYIAININKYDNNCIFIDKIRIEHF